MIWNMMVALDLWDWHSWSKLLRRSSNNSLKDQLIY